MQVLVFGRTVVVAFISHNACQLKTYPGGHGPGNSSTTAYKSLVTHQFKKVEELMASKTINELVLSSLKTSQELLMKKKDTIHQLDTQIIELKQEADALVEVILDIEDTQDRILEKVNLVDTFIKIHSTPPPQTLFTSPHRYHQLSLLLHPLNMMK